MATTTWTPPPETSTRSRNPTRKGGRMRTEVLTREDALGAGALRYYTGRPCKRGHLSERWVSTRICIGCARGYQDRFKERHADRVASSRRAHCQANIDRLRAISKRNQRVKVEVLATRPRPNACEVCGERPDGKGLHFDHDHVTGSFRGWLCHHCNVSIGMVNDDPVRLRALVKYLENGGPV